MSSSSLLSPLPDSDSLPPPEGADGAAGAVAPMLPQPLPPALSISSWQLTLLDDLAVGLPPAARETLVQALRWADQCYAGSTLETGELVLDHGVGMARIAAVLELDLDARLAALLFALPTHGRYAEAAAENWRGPLMQDFGVATAHLVEGMLRLNHIRLLSSNRGSSTEDGHLQAEILRKMLLAMVEDIRVVLLRLASRNQTMRYLTGHPGALRERLAHESLDLYAPLANRLGVWQMKWELEDLSFRFLEPATYKRIARMLDERRVERERFIEDTKVRLKAEMQAAGITAEVQGRPKHIYSIWNKMRAKRLEFDEVYDVRALRILVSEVADCYAALGIVHGRWQPVPGEFDDYIIQPKGNDYRSLHTAVIAEDGRPFEVQIRTYEMHYHSELGVAAHWRYKETGQSKESSRNEQAYDDKISYLRQLLSWRDEITDSTEWVAHFKKAELDDTIYVLTPQGRVFDLARGATPVDFAYRLHTDLGHRCRGARVDGQLVPLNTPLISGQRVEIITVRQGGPSRDWLNPALGYLASHRAKQKVRQWFSAQEDENLLAQGRAHVVRELQRDGQTQANIEMLAQRLGHKSVEDFYRAAGRGEVGTRLLQEVLRSEEDKAAEEAQVPQIVSQRSRIAAGNAGVLVVGVDKLMTQLARCCRPVPPDVISGFVTRGKGVSIHRSDCRTFRHIATRHPERVIATGWGKNSADGQRHYSVGLVVEAQDRQGLLRDISEVLSRERINVTAVKTLSRSGTARMSFTVELTDVKQLQHLLRLIQVVPGVSNAWRS